MNVFSKSTARAPLLYLFLLLSIGLISFGFVGKAAEYIIVQRETRRIEGYYRDIGGLRELQPVTQSQRETAIALLRADPAIDLVDEYAYSSGVMQNDYNTDFFRGTDDSLHNPNMQPGVHNMEFWFLGKLTDREEITANNAQGEPFFAGIMLTFDVDRRLAGYPDRMRSMGTYGVWIPMRYHPNAEAVAAALREMEIGKRYLMRGNTDPFFGYTVTETSWLNRNYAFPLRPLDGEGQYYLEVPPGQDSLLEQAEYAHMRKRMAFLEENIHSLLLAGTEDMSALPQMQESSREYYLTQGRWLNRDDQAAQKCGIVITQNLAEERELALGDLITLKTRSITDPYYGYARNADLESWQPAAGPSMNFEVVGIYSSSFLSSSYIYHDISETTAYVPKSCLPSASLYPTDSQPLAYPGLRFSFVLHDPRQRQAFTERLQATLAELGFSLGFVDNGAETFFASSDPVKASTSSGLVILSIVLVLALALAVFLYLRQQQRNFAIVRGLGLPASQASRQMLTPLGVLGLLASAAGAYASWNNALGQAAESLSKMPTPAGVYPSASLSPAWLLGLWLLVMALLAAMAWLGLRRLQAASVLSLLQQGAGSAKNAADEGAPGLPQNENLRALPAPLTGGPAILSGRALAGFGRRQAARATLKSILALILGLGFVLALGWLRANIVNNQAQIQNLFENTMIVADLNTGPDPQDPNPGIPANPAEMNADFNPFSRKLVDALAATGYFRHLHVESFLEISSIFPDPGTSDYQKVHAHYLRFTPDLAITKNYCLVGAQITWLPGYDESIFTRAWSEADLEAGPPPLLMPLDMMAEHGLELGGTVTWMDVQGKKRTFLIVGSTIGDGCGTVTNTTDHRTGASKQYGPYFGIYVPLGLLEPIYGYQLDRYRVALYLDPAYYRDLERVKAETAALMKEPGLSKWPVHLKYWDEALGAALVPLEDNLALLELLYPVSVAVSVLIGFGLSLALVLQQARESALLRVLGVGAVPLRLLLSGTQLLLALAGVLLGLGLLALLRGPAGLGP